MVIVIVVVVVVVEGEWGGIVVIVMRGKDCGLPAGRSSISLLVCEMSHTACVISFKVRA